MTYEEAIKQIEALLDDIYTQIGEAGKAEQTRIEYVFESDVNPAVRNLVINHIKNEDGYGVEIPDVIKIDWSNK